MSKILKQGEIYKYPKGTKVRIKDSVQCHQAFHDGGALIFQDRNDVDKGEYRVGIETEIGACFDFHPDEYELINTIIKRNMTYREKYAEKISSFTQNQLIQEEIEQKALITVYKERLEICTNDKKVHDAHVGIKRANIRLDEIRKRKTIKKEYYGKENRL